MSLTNYSRYKYTPDEMSEGEFLSKFVVRNNEFEEIFEDITQANYSVPTQHYIIIGQRGQGKTTLLRKIMLEVQSDTQLSAFILPIKFAEEQYQIRSLSRLWEEVADYLQSYYPSDFPDVLDNMELHFDDDDYELKCFSYLEKAVNAKKKKLVLLIDNIDELLGKLKIKEQRQFREILLSSAMFRIIGGSTKMLEQHFDYGKPFYEFFKIVKIVGLDKDESLLFLRTIANEQQRDKIEKIIEHSPERIETLRRLTGGVPRTLVMLFDIFIEESDNAFEDLLKVLADATPLYKHRMDDLPDMLQDITHHIAMNWDGMLTKDIAKKTRLESKVVSAQLKQLEQKYGIIESVSIGKNKIYKIEERFFNIWYLMRYGRKNQRQKVEWLVRFLVSWCSPAELESRASRLIDAVKENKLQESYAYNMCEALSYTGLEVTTEHEMKTQVKSYLISKDSNLVREVSPSDFDILKQAIELSQNKDNPGAISLLLDSTKSSNEIHYLLALLYAITGQLEQAKMFYLEAIKSGNNEALYDLGLLYEDEKSYDKAQEYYLRAIDSGNQEAVHSIGRLFFKQAAQSETALLLTTKAYEKAKTYHNTHSLAVISLWLEDFTVSYDKFIEWLEYDELDYSTNDIPDYLCLLMAKKQYYKAKEFFELAEHDFKNRYKPLWYALMSLMQDDFPHEIKKMGSELIESVDEVLQKITQLNVKYSLD